MVFTSEGVVNDYATGSEHYTHIQTHVASTSGVDTAYVSISVTSASVNMDVFVTVPTGQTATAISNSLTNTYVDASTTSALLGIQVTSDPSINIDYVGDDDDDRLGTGAVVGVAIGASAAVLIVLLCTRTSVQSIGGK